MNNKYKFELKEHKNVAIFHFLNEIPKISISNNLCDTLGKKLRSSILEINGVVDLYSDKYSIKVEKGELFEWSNIENKVIEKVSHILKFPKLEKIVLTK